MNCNPEAVILLASGELEGDEKKTQTDHIAGCSTCRELFVQFSRIDGALEEEGACQIVPMHDLIDNALTQPTPVRRFPNPLALAAAILLFISIGYFVSRPPKTPPPSADDNLQTLSDPLLSARLTQLDGRIKATRKDTTGIRKWGSSVTQAGSIDKRFSRLRQRVRDLRNELEPENKENT